METGGLGLGVLGCSVFHVYGKPVIVIFEFYVLCELPKKRFAFGLELNVFKICSRMLGWLLEVFVLSVFDFVLWFFACTF